MNNNVIAKLIRKSGWNSTTSAGHWLKFKTYNTPPTLTSTSKPPKSIATPALTEWPSVFSSSGLFVSSLNKIWWKLNKKRNSFKRLLLKTIPTVKSETSNTVINRWRLTFFPYNKIYNKILIKHIFILAGANSNCGLS